MATAKAAQKQLAKMVGSAKAEGDIQTAGRNWRSAVDDDQGAWDDDDGFADELARFEEGMDKKSQKARFNVGPSKADIERKKAQEYEEQKRNNFFGGDDAARVAQLAMEDEKMEALRMQTMQAESLKQRLMEERLAKKAAQREKRKRAKAGIPQYEEWQKKQEMREAFEGAWAAKEEEHQKLVANHQQVKDAFERQARIDKSWEDERKADAPATDEAPETTASAEGSAPVPAKKSGGKAGGKKAGGKKGGKKKPVDLSKYGNVSIAAKQQPTDDAVAKKLPWDAAQGDLDPLRPDKDRREDAKKWEKQQKEWRAYTESWSKQKAEHQAEKDRLHTQGYYDEAPVVRDLDDVSSSDSGSDETDSDD